MPGNDFDIDILEKCKKNDRRAQEKLYKQFLGPMWSICMRYTGNREEALEVMNDGFLKIFGSLDKYDPARAGLQTWMSRIMINTTIDFIRKRRTVQFIPVAQAETTSVPTVDDLPDTCNVQQLVYYINQLPETTKLVFNLYTVEGYSHDEIAGFLHISSSTSRWHVTEARKRLREIINKNEGSST